MTKELICPYTENCLVYKNWLNDSNDKNLTVIIREDDGINYCLAIGILQDPLVEDTNFIEDFRNRLPKKQENLNEVDCAYIEQLNLLERILKK